MLQQFFSSRKSILLVLAGIVILALLALIWRIVLLQNAASSAAIEPVLKIGYCGAEPEELCVLSFGRDVDENMAVNLFAPNRKFPDFYLKITRAAGESIYECEKDKEVPTSVFCYGDMVNLQEKMEVSLIAKSDERLIAAGDFVLKAILISESSFAGGAGGISTQEAAVSGTPITTENFNASAATPTLTLTPDASYPNSSYPNSQYP